MKTTPKDFFLHLGALVALYAVAISLINLWFSIINYYFPDELSGYFYGGSVAWPISMLVVLVPILYILEWLINRDIAKIPEKKDLWIRTWRIYIIFFSAIALVGGDFIALINTYLNGEITARFVYKIIVILLVGGTVGKYYFYSLYTNFKWSNSVLRLNPIFGIILVVGAITIGFVAVGSPATQRAYRFDDRRLNDLNTIQWQIINYWQQKSRLPKILNDLTDSVSGFVIPLDPETKKSYEYNVVQNSSLSNIDGVSFELCAEFSRATPDTTGRGVYSGRISYPNVYSGPYGIDSETNWKHDAGRTCFTRNIDPDRYPINKPAASQNGI